MTNGTAWSIGFWTNGGNFDTRKKILETRSTNVVVGLLVPMDYDCYYDSV